VKKRGSYKQRRGREGEELAALFLIKRGYSILERNFRIGRGEIDIIAIDGDVLVFIEVKTKQTEGFGEPEEWVDRKKQLQICKTAMLYLQKYEIEDMQCRFDVIGVTKKDDTVNIKHIKDAFWIDMNQLEKRFEDIHDR